MSHPKRITEDGGADCDLNHRDAAQEVSEGRICDLQTILVIFWERLYLLFVIVQ